MAKKQQITEVEGEVFDEPVPDENTVDEDAFAALQSAWEEEQDG